LRLCIICLDGLEYDLVERFNLKTLMQVEYGKVNLDLIRRNSNYPCTVDCWSTFLSGRFKHKVDDVNETFLKFFSSYVVIGVPGFKVGIHRRHRDLVDMLGEVLDGKMSLSRYEEKVKIHTISVMTQTFSAIHKNPDVLLTYFPTPDLLGHLYFNSETKMREIYGFIERVVARIKPVLKDTFTLIVSDHGMVPWYEKKKGEHSWHGFYSANWKLEMENIGIEDFYQVIENLAKR